MDKYDPATITEFPRFEPETPQGGVTTFFNKILKFPLFSPGETSESGQNKPPVDNSQQRTDNNDKSKQEDESKPETGSYAVEIEGRSLPNVLRRISSLVALGSGAGTRYEDTELARYWMPDDISLECYECAARFSTLRRRHHCRVCGQIFCSRCCSQRIPGQIFGCAGGLRVCNYCCNVVLSYLRENDMAGDMSPDIRSLQENLKCKFPEAASETRDFMFGRESTEDRDVIDTRNYRKEDIDLLYRDLVCTLPTQTHRYRLVRYTGVWRGSDMMQWVMNNTYSKTRVQATTMCQNLVSSGYVESCVEIDTFADYALYRPVVMPNVVNPDTRECDTAEVPNRLCGSTSSYRLDLNLDESSARLIRDKLDTPTQPYLQNDQSPGAPVSRDVDISIWESGEEHLRLLCRQVTARAGLTSHWADVLYPLCRQAADTISIDVMSGDIDVRNYVQVKKVPGGRIADSQLVHGCVISKNVAHRAMPQRISNPSILLLDCSIAYHRVEGKFTSLEPILLQEQEYLIRCAARITALRPNVVIARGSVSRTVQEVLLVEGVCVVSGVGGAGLRRAGRAAGGVPVSTLDAHLHLPTLGTAGLFYVHNFGTKTLMVLENCANPHLNCCILLRGAPVQELIKVKKIAKFMTLACYNWKLERALLTDFQARLPEPGMKFINEKTEESNDSCQNVTESGNSENDGRQSELANRQSEPVNLQNESGSHQSEPASRQSESVSHQSEPASRQSESVSHQSESVNLQSESARHQSETVDGVEEEKSEGFRKFRKTDSDKLLSCGVPIRDFSDPLRAKQSSVDDDHQDDDVFKVDSQTERWCSDDVILCMSPSTVVPPPRDPAPLRRYFHLPALPAVHPPTAVAPHTPRQRRKSSRCGGQDVTMQEYHPFITNPITSSAEDPETKSSLAHYRATGCRLVYSQHKVGCPSYNPSVLKRAPPLERDREECERDKDNLDPFDPENHQRLSLLIYSYSHKSPNVPDFCVNPWIATMEMYGKHDITLGAFLEKYCFNNEYKCPSANCPVPMNQHVRKFVHGDVCITVTCNIIGHSGLDKKPEQKKQKLVWWSQCSVCGSVGPRVAMSPPPVSLGVYLRGRVLPTPYLTHCPHPLHTHLHMFHKGDSTLCFKYEKITTYEIELPPDLIVTNYDTKAMRDSLINQLNELVSKGHEFFSGVNEAEAEKDQLSFKQHMDQIHLALTSNALQEHSSLAGVVRSLWSVSDRIILGEKLLRDSQDKFTTPNNKNKNVNDNIVEEKSELEDAIESSNENSDTPKDESEKAVGDEDEEKGDKKTVKQILMQLLSNNQFSNQAGIVISGGVVPVVLAGEIGSVVAATLASLSYLNSLHSLTSSLSEEESEAVSTSKDKSDGDKSKAVKSNEHIEVVLRSHYLASRHSMLLEEGLVCRVYYARQFHKLRHLLLAPLSHNTTCNDDKGGEKSLCEIEEGFIRSLAHCVPWAAKGGKSGSTFCKTKDDRYVLKEMTKPEWQQFLEFAPHYFNYVISCLQNQYPTLLGRIVGVYAVGAAGTGVLVMENLMYGRGAGGDTFDLKGALRHRLAADTVLFDQNLLKRRWESPLFLQSDRATVLTAAVERDTSFLADNDVMDYSLLLGVHQHTLVLGVIDYIRTFTWDKKLEHYVKKNLGSGQPTVVSPIQYKNRFCTAMTKYFLHAPAHWDHLTRGLIHPPNKR